MPVHALSPLVFHQHFTKPVELSEHVPVDRAASATTPGIGDGTNCSPSVGVVVAQVTAPVGDKAQK